MSLTTGQQVDALRHASLLTKAASIELTQVSAAPDDTIDYLATRLTRISLSLENEADYLTRHANLDDPAETA